MLALRIDDRKVPARLVRANGFEYAQAVRCTGDRCAQLTCWYPVGHADEARALLGENSPHVGMLTAGERGALLHTLDGETGARRWVGAAQSYRGQTYRQFDLGVVWRLPRGLWIPTEGADTWNDVAAGLDWRGTASDATAAQGDRFVDRRFGFAIEPPAWSDVGFRDATPERLRGASGFYTWSGAAGLVMVIALYPDTTMSSDEGMHELVKQQFLQRLALSPHAAAVPARLGELDATTERLRDGSGAPVELTTAVVGGVVFAVFLSGDLETGRTSRASFRLLP